MEGGAEQHLSALLCTTSKAPPPQHHGQRDVEAKHQRKAADLELRANEAESLRQWRLAASFPYPHILDRGRALNFFGLACAGAMTVA